MNALLHTLGRAGWLDEITAWLMQLFTELFGALVELLGDMLLRWFAHFFELFAMAVEQLPVPEFLTGYSLGTLLGSAGPIIGWILGVFRVPEGLAIIGAGYVFRLVRKLLTLGQW